VCLRRPPLPASLAADPRRRALSAHEGRRPDVLVARRVRGLRPKDPHLPREDGRRRSAFDLEDWAVSWSSFALSLAIAVYGVTRPSWFAVPFVVSGAVGLVVTWLAQRLFRDRFDRVVDLSA
jgi:hypothetical protein